MSYEELRRKAIGAKISILESSGLGIDATASGLHRKAALRNAPKVQRPRAKKRRRERNGDDDEYLPDISSVPRRRSLRMLSVAIKSYADVEQSDEEAELRSSDRRDSSSKQRRRDGPPISSGDATLPSAAEAAGIIAASSTGSRAEGSSRDLRADLDRMEAEWLGKQIPYRLGGPGKQAKRAAMQTACATPKTVRFSRMSGI